MMANGNSNRGHRVRLYINFDDAMEEPGTVPLKEICLRKDILIPFPPFPGLEIDDIDGQPCRLTIEEIIWVHNSKTLECFMHSWSTTAANFRAVLQEALACGWVDIEAGGTQIARLRRPGANHP